MKLLLVLESLFQVLLRSFIGLTHFCVLYSIDTSSDQQADLRLHPLCHPGVNSVADEDVQVTNLVQNHRAVAMQLLMQDYSRGFRVYC